MEGCIHHKSREKVDKAEELEHCDNCSGISLLSIAGKAFTKILSQRITGHIEECDWFSESQNGGRPGRSTIDGIHTARLACEYRTEKRLPTYMSFFDLKKAYDRVPREALWQVLQKNGIAPNMLTVVKKLHEGMHASVVVETQRTDRFEVLNGVRQGCCLASLLFNIYIYIYIYAAAWTRIWTQQLNDNFRLHYKIDCIVFGHGRPEMQRVKPDVLIVKDGKYVDDAAALSTHLEDQAHAAATYQSIAKQAGQEMSIKKTKTLNLKTDKANIEVEGGTIKGVDQITYLGSEFEASGQCNIEVNKRLSKARCACSMLWKKVWGVRQLSLATKMAVYKACILPVLLYGSETWPVSRPCIKKMNQQQMRWLRSITGINRKLQATKSIKDVEIRIMCRIQDIEEMLHQEVLRWAGHVARMPNTRTPKQILFAWWPEGIRTSQNSISRYKFRLAEALRSRRIPEKIWLQITQYRNEWWQLVKGKQYDELAQPTLKAKSAPKAKPKPQAKAKAGYILCPYPRCGHQCKGKLGLAKHTQMAHTEGTKAAGGFQCDQCPYFTKSQKALMEHKRNPINHTDESFICPNCQAHFPSRSTRNKHKTYSCHKKDQQQQYP